MHSDTVLFYDGRRATLARADGHGGVSEYVTDRSPPKSPIVWFRPDGKAAIVPPVAAPDLSWPRSEDPYEVAEVLARECSAAMCRTEDNYARAKARLASSSMGD